MIAVVWSGFAASFQVEIAVQDWDGVLLAGDPQLSWAGQAARFVSTPLFIFLVLRWFLRFVVWVAPLFDISRLGLQLSPLHPDHAAGLGFLAPLLLSGVPCGPTSVVRR